MLSWGFQGAQGERHEVDCRSLYEVDVLRHLLVLQRGVVLEIQLVLKWHIIETPQIKVVHDVHKGLLGSRYVISELPPLRRLVVSHSQQSPLFLVIVKCELAHFPVQLYVLRLFFVLPVYIASWAHAGLKRDQHDLTVWLRVLYLDHRFKFHILEQVLIHVRKQNDRRFINVFKCKSALQFRTLYLTAIEINAKLLDRLPLVDRLFRIHVVCVQNEPVNLVFLFHHPLKHLL